MDKLNPMPHEAQTWINTIWEALDHTRDSYTDEQWDQICMAMAWTAETLDCTDPIYLQYLSEEEELGVIDRHV